MCASLQLSKNTHANTHTIEPTTQVRLFKVCTINVEYEFYVFLWLMYSTLEILMNEKVNSYNFCSNWTPNAKKD
jgi:hypothetical protein